MYNNIILAYPRYFHVWNQPVSGAVTSMIMAYLSDLRAFWAVVIINGDSHGNYLFKSGYN